MIDRFINYESRQPIKRSAKVLHVRRDGVIYFQKSLVDARPELWTTHYVHLSYCNRTGEIAMKPVENWEANSSALSPIANTIQIVEPQFSASMEVEPGYYSLLYHTPRKIYVFGLNPRSKPARYEVVAIQDEEVTEGDIQAALELVRESKSHGL